MSIVVQKYGGSSVANLESLTKVANQVVARKKDGAQVVVVVSAMGKTTDDLIAMAKKVSEKPPRRELDMLVTAGERISMALLSMAIHKVGVQAISFTGSQSGIITEDSHQGAQIVEVNPYRIKDELNNDRVVIVAGYQGVSLKKEVTTLGRGGSDTSAVALAAALGADCCEIYSDVDGVYSADPRICPQAKHLPELSYETMQAMAGVGAKVLNAEAIEFARRAGIKVNARKTGDKKGRETIIHHKGSTGEGVVAIVGAAFVTRIKGSSEKKVQFIERVLQVGGIPIAMVLDNNLDIIVRVDNIPGCDPQPLEEIAKQEGLDSAQMIAISLVGSGLLKRSEILLGIQQLMESMGIHQVTLNGGDACLTMTFEAKKGLEFGNEVVRRLHSLNIYENVTI